MTITWEQMNKELRSPESQAAQAKLWQEWDERDRKTPEGRRMREEFARAWARLQRPAWADGMQLEAQAAWEAGL